MAGMRFKLELKVYRDMTSMLSSFDNGEMDAILNDITENAFIINDEPAPEEELIVSVKISDSDNMNAILKGYRTVGVTRETDKYADKLIKTFNERLERDALVAKKQAEYDAWLKDCFDKFVTDNTSPTCKELAVLINNNCLKPGQDKIKYQNIMKPLKAYRQEKFGG